MLRTDTRFPAWRVAFLTVAALVLLVPAIAMQFSTEVAWGPGDFLIMGGLLLGLWSGIEVMVRLPRSQPLRLAGAGFAVAVFLLVWAELAVGVFD